MSLHPTYPLTHTLYHEPTQSGFEIFLEDEHIKDMYWQLLPNLTIMTGTCFLKTSSTPQLWLCTSPASPQPEGRGNEDTGTRVVRTSSRRWNFIFFLTFHTPAAVQFPPLLQVPELLSLYNILSYFSSSLFFHLIWAALAEPLTRMALTGEEQRGEMLSVPVENSSLNLKQQAPKSRHNNTATCLSLE